MWSYLVNNFGGMGDPVSVEAIFYKNGTMKFQYQVEGFGNDLTSGFSTIGVQLDSVTGVLVSAYAPLDHGNGLAYTLVPVRKYTIAPGETLTGNINFDARNVYGGVYNEPLKIQTNVPGSEMLEKPVELTVAGDAELAAADTVDFGSKMIAFEWGSPAVNSTDLVLSNTGSAPMDITWAQMADGTQGLSLMMLADGWFGPEWTDIANIYSPWAWETPVYTIKPGDNLVVRAIFYPSTPGDFLDEVVLTTSIGEQRIVLKGTAFNPPALNLDNASVEVAMNTPAEVIDRTIAFDNINGYSPLEYMVSIDYGRILTEANGKEKLSEQPGSAALVTAGGVKHTDGGARVQGTYNRVATHTDKEAPDTFIGTGGAAPFTVATRYNGGPEGFNVTHVETWFRLENVLTGTVQVEVRAGGTSIANAKSLSKGTIEFTGTGADEGGTWYAAQLDAPAAIYPNEDFYVLVTYPLGISFPVGTIETDGAAGRYYYMDEGLWYDLQEASSFEQMGWLMYAGEETAANAAWLSVTSATDGSVEAGESDAIALTFTGANATRGDQVAIVVIHSNDPDHAEMKVPVTLHLNEAPHFDGETQTLFVAENENRTVTISVTDTEEDTFTVAEQAAPDFAVSTFADGILTLVLSPQYGDAGQYTITWQAKDAHDAIEEHTVAIDVAHTNQAPVFVGDDKMLMYATKGRMESYLIQDYFGDPDNDTFTFMVISQNTEVAQVFADPSGFIVKPGAAGEAMLRFTLTDSHGATTQDSLRAVVNVILGVDETADQGLSAYPNPVVDYMNVSLSSEWTGDVLLEVVDAAGRVHVSREVVTGNESGVRLNLATLPQGLYLLRASAYNKEATFKS
ncbi:MAG: T9SS type A sorting domain-containing protein [Bacteroidia bacterium]|nr:T9SS type A sorting domain-containing protein [Bacteroidia bacterium]